MVAAAGAGNRRIGRRRHAQSGRQLRRHRSDFQGIAFTGAISSNEYGWVIHREPPHSSRGGSPLFIVPFLHDFSLIRADLSLHYGTGGPTGNLSKPHVTSPLPLE